MAISRPRLGQSVTFHHQGRTVQGELLTVTKPTLRVWVPYANGQGGRTFDIHWTKLSSSKTPKTPGPEVLPKSWTPAMVRTNPAGQVQLRISTRKLNPSLLAEDPKARRLWDIERWAEEAAGAAFDAHGPNHLPSAKSAYSFIRQLHDDMEDEDLPILSRVEFGRFERAYRRHLIHKR